jgi:hypothetical protein
VAERNTPVARVVVTLIDKNGLSIDFTDDQLQGKPFIALHDSGWASRAITAQITTTPDAVLGDHALLTAQAQADSTDTITLDPWLENTTINLAAVDKGFDGRACGLQFVLNNQGRQAYARMRLFNESDSVWPSLCFYDVEQQGESLIYLQPYYFVQKTARLQADFVGPTGWVNNQKIAVVKCTLYDGESSLEVDVNGDNPSATPDLRGMANKASAINFATFVSQHS